MRSRRTAESAKDSRRLAEFAADGGISERLVAAGRNHLCARDAPAIGIRRSRRTAESATYPRQIRGGWRNLVFAADGGISHRFAAAGGNHFCARDAPPVEKRILYIPTSWDTGVQVKQGHLSGGDCHASPRSLLTRDDGDLLGFWGVGQTNGRGNWFVQWTDFEPARLSAPHLGAGETSETNIKV